MPESPTRKSGNSAGWRPCATASDASRASAFDGPVTKVSNVQGRASCATGRSETMAALGTGAAAASQRTRAGDAESHSGASSIATSIGRPPTSLARLPMRAAKWLRMRSRWNALGASSTRRSGASRTVSGWIQASRLTAEVSVPSRRKTPSQTVGGEVIQLLPLIG